MHMHRHTCTHKHTHTHVHAFTHTRMHPYPPQACTHFWVYIHDHELLQLHSEFKFNLGNWVRPYLKIKGYNRAGDAALWKTTCLTQSPRFYPQELKKIEYLQVNMFRQKGLYPGWHTESPCLNLWWRGRKTEEQNEIFFFCMGGYKGGGWTWKDWEMSGVGGHDVKLPKNQ